MKYRYREEHEMKDSCIKWLKVIPKTWKRKSLKYELEFSVGGTPSTGISEYFGGDNIWVTISDIKDKFVSESKIKLTKKGIKNSSMNLMPIGSLLYTFKLSVGQVTFAKVDLYTNEAIASFKPNKKYNLNFWYYALSNYLIQYANENIYGAKLMNQELIKNAKLLVPSKGEQQKIANFLDQKTAEFDLVIEKKEKLIEKLEEAKKSLISEVVTGKKQVQVISNKSYKISDDGQEQEVFKYSLRNREPHEMKDSGVEWLGMIPEGWEVTKLKYLAKISNGKDQKEVLEDNGKYPILGTGGEFGRSNTYLYNKASVLLGRKGTIDKPQYIEKPFWTVDTLFYTQIAKNVNPKFFFYLCQTIDFNKYATKTALPSMTQEDLNQIKFSYNNKFIEQQKITDCLDQKTNRFDSIIQKNKGQIKKIKEAKQSLISEAVTGKIEVL